MKKIILICGICLLLVGCGNKYGMDADFSCTAELKESKFTYDATLYVYLKDGYLNKINVQMDMRSQADADEACATFKNQENAMVKDMTVTCDGKTIYIEDYMTTKNNSKLNSYTKETFISEIQESGYKCK